MGRGLDQFGELPATLRDSSEAEKLMQLNTIVLKACQADVRSRYQTMAEMRTDLLRLLEG